MARSDKHHPAATTPETDWLEQEQPLDPVEADDEPWPPAPAPEFNEADVLEQAQSVASDPDEEYPPLTP